MTPEPLKDKRQNQDVLQQTGKDFFTSFWQGKDNSFYYHEDIKSAVEWLKDKLQFFPETMENDFKILELLDEAFEDVVKK